MVKHQGRSLSAILTLVVAAAMGGPMASAEPGDLFPNVAPYDETVASPITKPEIRKPTPPEPPKLPDPTKPTPPAPDPTKIPAPDTNNTPVPPPPPPVRPWQKKKPLRIRPTTTQPGTLTATTTTAPAPPPPPLVEFTPYAELVMKPIVSPEDAQAFEQAFGDPITKALAGTVDQRKKTADLLDSAATSATSPDLKRYLLLHAFGLYIRGGIPSLEREQKAQALLPVLTEKTLPVIQARADALNDLMMTFNANPNERFLDLYVDAHATLTKFRVQAGFPKEALDSLKKMREAALHYSRKPQVRTDEIVEAAAWCDRANQAVALAPKYQETLKANPNDPVANTMMATLHLSLYGSLENAAPFAAKSDRKDLKQLAAVLKENPPDDLSEDPAKHALQVLAIGAALVDVAKATSVSQLFDRYSIACFAGDHVAQVVDGGLLPPAKMMEAKVLLASAKDVVDKTNFKRGEDLPKWLGGGTGSSTGATATAETPKKTLTTVADFFKGLPKELAPADTGWTKGQMSQINDWMAKSFVGQAFDGQVFYEPPPGTPVDGADGKVYVPVTFQFQNVQLKDQLWVKTFIEVRMKPTLASKTKDLQFEQQVEIKGKIESAELAHFSSFPGEPKIVKITVIVTPKE